MAKRLTHLNPLTEIGIRVLILYSVVMCVLEIDLEGTKHSLEGSPFWIWSERVVAGLLTVEFYFRLRQGGRKYLWSTMGLIDLIAFAPFWIGFALPIQYLHYVRSMRVFRLLKFYRYSRAMQAFIAGLVKARERLAGMGMVVIVLILFAAVGIYEIEGDIQPDKFGNLSNSIWWTVVTLSTVGYGDAVPETVAGKWFALVIMIVGLGITAAFIGIVGQSVYDELINCEELEQTRDDYTSQRP